LFCLITVLGCTTASNAQSKDVYFSPGWCPRADEINKISEHLTLQMNGCCILKGIPKATDGLPRGALDRWSSKIFPNSYPSARCDGVVVSEAQEQEMAVQAAKAEEEQKEQSKNKL
jgi:hypothetical protein